MARAERLFALWARALERLFPDPFTLSLTLTLVTFVIASILTPHSPGTLVSFWGEGLWTLLDFAMQMGLILVTGQALAEAPLVARWATRLAGAPKTQSQGVVVVSLAALCCAWLNWGFGLIVGAILARQVADSLSERLGAEQVSRGLLGAAGYSGLAFWHGGLSGSAPLAVAQEGHAMQAMTGVLPLSETVFSTSNLTLSLLLLILVPAFLVALSRLGLATTGEEVAPRPPAPEVAKRTVGAAFLVALTVGVAGWWWGANFRSLDLNTMVFLFLFLGLAAHGSAPAYAQALDRSISSISGIVLQFPFYAGIVAVASKSGLVGVMSHSFVSASHSVEQSLGIQPFLLFVFLSAGLVNLFVPSGGGQWVIQGPIVLQAGQELGIDPGATVMALAYGDQWTNLLQPFWALPLLSITGLKPSQLLSVSTLLLLWFGLIIGTVLLVLGS